MLQWLARARRRGAHRDRGAEGYREARQRERDRWDDARQPDAGALAAHRAGRGANVGQAGRAGDADGERRRASGMTFIHRCAVTSGLRVGLAHVRALFRVPIVVGPREMIDPGVRIDPDHRIGRAMSACLFV